MQVSHIKHLVLSGGGMLGISYIGLVKYLEENLPNPIINNLKSITGCSAGALFGTLIAIGYTYTEMINLAKNMNFKEYMVINAESIINFMKLKGLESGKNLNTFVKKCIKDKVGNEDITFKEIKKKFNIDLQIGVTNLSKSRFEIMNSTNTPDIPVHKAISASIAIPFVFEPVVFGEDVYCDGGLLNNLPIEDIFMNKTNIDTHNADTKEEKHTEKQEDKSKLESLPEAESILAIYLINEANTISKDNYQSASLSQYMSTLIHTISNEYINKKIELNINNNTNNESKNEKYKIIVFKIPCDIMKFLKINSSHEDIDNIIDIAYNTTKLSFTERL